MFKCCGTYHKGSFNYIFHKPVYRMIEYGICPTCGQEILIDYKQVQDGEDNFKEKIKFFKGKAAKKELIKWKAIINNIPQGSKTKQFFYYGTFTEHKGTWKIYRTNFNNEKELIANQ